MNDDLISRKMAINEAYPIIIDGEKFDVIQVETLMGLPPAHLKQKIGRWILFDECANAGYYCSECHKKIVREGWSKTVKKIKFCPNCGAMMRSQQNGNI